MSADPTPTTLATWVYLLHTGGVSAADERVAACCADLDAAEAEEAGNAAGESLVARVSELLGGTSPGDVGALASALYGDDVAADMGAGSREDRIHRIRKYQFSRGLPWLARVYERREDGVVSPGWLLVERVTDQVAAMDPNPWDDVDEDRVLPVEDFQVLWELDGCSSVHVA